MRNKKLVSLLVLASAYAFTLPFNGSAHAQSLITKADCRAEQSAMQRMGAPENEINEALFPHGVNDRNHDAHILQGYLDSYGQVLKIAESHGADQEAAIFRLTICSYNTALARLRQGVAGQSPEKFGALAIDSNQGKAYGWAVNWSSPRQAEQHALSECSRNGRNCSIVLRFGRSTCAAYSADQDQDSTAYGWGKTDNLGQAQNLANSNCQSRGGRSCVNRAWGCNSP